MVALQFEKEAAQPAKTADVCRQSGYYTTLFLSYSARPSSPRPLSPLLSPSSNASWLPATVIVNTESVIRRRLRKPKADKQQLTRPTTDFQLPSFSAGCCWGGGEGAAGGRVGRSLEIHLGL